MRAWTTHGQKAPKCKSCLCPPRRHPPPKPAPQDPELMFMRELWLCASLWEGRGPARHRLLPQTHSLSCGPRRTRTPWLAGPLAGGRARAQHLPPPGLRGEGVPCAHGPELLPRRPPSESPGRVPRRLSALFPLTDPQPRRLPRGRSERPAPSDQAPNAPRGLAQTSLGHRSAPTEDRRSRPNHCPGAAHTARAAPPQPQGRRAWGAASGPAAGTHRWAQPRAATALSRGKA